MATTTPWSTWLRDALHERDWTAADLVRRGAGAFGSSEVSRWVSGKVTPGLDSIRRVCETLGVPAVQGMIAAGHLEPRDVGVTVVERQHRAAGLSNVELVEEVARRLDSASVRIAGTPLGLVESDTDEDRTGGEGDHPERPTRGREGEMWAARRTSRTK